MPVGQQVDVLPSLAVAVPAQQFRPPPQTAPARWQAKLVPNLADWQPGDVVLVGRRGLSGNLIALAQRLILPIGMADGHWSHCAIYIGGGEVIDAMPGNGKGVRQRDLQEYCQLRNVARLRLELAGSLLNPVDGKRVADTAAMMLTLPYAMSSLGGIAARSLVTLFGMSQLQVRSQVKKVYCSSLVVMAYLGLGIRLDDDANVLPCMPANLQFHHALWTGAVTWHVTV